MHSINCSDPVFVTAFAKMKSFGVVLCCALFAHLSVEVASFGSTNDHPAMKNLQKVCREKVKVDDEIYKRAIEKGELQSDDRGLQCYARCVFEVAGAMDEKGNVNMAPFMSGMQEDARAFYGPLTVACQNEIAHNEDLCLKAMQLYQCFKEKAGDKFYFV